MPLHLADEVQDGQAELEGGRCGVVHPPEDLHEQAQHLLHAVTMLSIMRCMTCAEFQGHVMWSSTHLQDFVGVGVALGRGIDAQHMAQAEGRPQLHVLLGSAPRFSSNRIVRTHSRMCHHCPCTLSLCARMSLVPRKAVTLLSASLCSCDCSAFSKTVPAFCKADRWLADIQHCLLLVQQEQAV